MFPFLNALPDCPDPFTHRGERCQVKSWRLTQMNFPLGWFMLQVLTRSREDLPLHAIDQPIIGLLSLYVPPLKRYIFKHSRKLSPAFGHRMLPLGS
jgi:hypothetical protein